MGHVEPYGRVDSGSGLQKMRVWARKLSANKNGHTQYGFPVSVVAKIKASLGRPRFLSSTRGKRLPMSDPWVEQQ